MSQQYTVVLEETLSPGEERRPVSISNNPKWKLSEGTHLISAAFDVVVANSATEARNAEYAFERLSAS